MSDYDDSMHEFANALFRRAENTDEPAGHERPTRTNVVPREGQTPAAPSTDPEMREFARNLFRTD